MFHFRCNTQVHSTLRTLVFVAKARNLSPETKSCEYQLKINFISSPKTPNKITLQSYLDGNKPTLYFLQNISCNTIASNINFDLRKTLLHQLSPNYRTSLSTEPWMHRKRASLVLFHHPYIIELWQSKWNKSELKVRCDEKSSQSCSKALKNWFVCIEKWQLPRVILLLFVQGFKDSNGKHL